MQRYKNIHIRVFIWKWDVFNKEIIQTDFKLRREGFITGNLFGKEIEGSIPLKIERLEAERTLRGCMKGTQIMLDVEGKMYDVLIKEIDFDATKNQTLEIDFQALVSNQKVQA